MKLNQVKSQEVFLQEGKGVTEIFPRWRKQCVKAKRQEEAGKIRGTRTQVFVIPKAYPV